jgi:hypothetical protein
MLFVPEIGQNDFQSLFERFLQIAGAPLWTHRIEWIKKQCQRNPLLKDCYNEYHNLEIQFDGLRRQWVRTGRVPTDVKDPARYKLYAFLTQFMRVHERLSPRGQNRLCGMLVDGLKDSRKKGLLSLQQEMTTSAHLLRLGFDVDFVDLEGAGRCDFVLRRDGIELDAECKMVSCDIGRKIPRVIAIEVLHRIQKEIEQTADRISGGRCLYVRIPDRLEAEQGRRDEIVRLAGRTLRTGIADELPGICRTSLLDFSLGELDFSDPNQISFEHVRSLSRKLVGNDNPQLSVFFKPGKMAVITIIESDQKDRVLEAIFDVLSESANDQLSKQRPGAIFVQLHDLSADAIKSLAERDTLDPTVATGLQLAATLFLDRPDRQHVHTLSFRSHGIVSQASAMNSDVQTTSTSEEGQAYVFKNPHSPVAADQRYSVFVQVPRESSIWIP